MTRNEIIDEIYSKNIIRNLIDRYGELKQDKADLEQDIYLLILNTNEDFIVELFDSGKLVNWLSATISNQIHSKTSYYFNNYKKLKYISRELNETDKNTIFEKQTYK